MKAYAMDLRARVLADSEEGLSTTEIARKPRVSASWVRRLKQRRRETREIAPRRSRYAAPQKLAGQEERLRTWVAEHPSATLAELRRDLGLAVDLSPLWRKLRELRLAFKKKPARRRTAPSGRGHPAHKVARGEDDLGSGAARLSR